MSASHQKEQFESGFINWVDTRLPIFSYIKQEYGVFPMPKNCNYFWSFGGMAMITLVTMILTGIILAMQYVPSTSEAFNSVERIMRDVNYGWLIRYIHMNGASMFFIVVYIHMFRGLYFGSYKQPRELIWILGVIIFVLMMATAFMGYVLPWGQMSFWGATVITNLFSAIPLVGDSIVTWLWGGFAVDNPTLNRFFALHYLFPFLILGIVMLHVAAMHVAKSNNPTGVEPIEPGDTVTFHPYFTSKDSFAIVIFIAVWAYFVFFAPNYLGHADNYIPANPLQTPAHIVPEWYFLPFYAILRAVNFELLGFIPPKLGGVILMFGAIILLAFLPWLDRSRVRSCRYRPIYKWLTILFAINFVVLGYCGAKPAEGGILLLAQLTTFWYFFHLVVLTPLAGFFERPLPLPTSISQAVLKAAA